MCNPVAIGVAGLGMNAASSYAQYKGQKAQSAQQRQNNWAQAQNDLRAIDYREIEESQDDMMARQEIIAAARRDRARARVSAGESGLLGASSDRLLTASHIMEGQFLTNVDTQGERRADQAERNRGAVRNGLTSANNLARKPSAFAAGLQIVGAGVDAYSQYKYNTGR